MNMLRNTWLKTLVVVAAFFSLSTLQSCLNLDEVVYSDLTSANFPSSREELIAAVGAVYTNLYSFQNHNSYFSLVEVASDEAMIPQRGADWFDGGQWLRVHRHEYTAGEESINNAWNFLYRGIGVANSVISVLKDPATKDRTGISDAEIELYIAELRGLRALYYLWLIDAFGNAPLVTDETEFEAQPTNTPRAEIYAFIESELTAIAPTLSADKTVNTYARFTRHAANTLLAKLYLNAEVYKGSAEWAKCVQACDAVINSNVFSLTADYFENFNTDNDNGGVGTSENIFCIPYDAVRAPGFNLPQMTLHYSSQATFQLQEQPWNGYCSLQEFYNSYEDGDVRKGEYSNQQVRGNFLAGQQFAADGVTPLEDTGAEPTDPDGPTLVFTPEINEHFPNALRQAGVRVGKFEYELGSPNSLNNDFPILRYADVLLMKAEALWKQNNAGEALVLVNQIRSRAGVDAFGDLNADNLLAERGREMFFEGWRRQDLIRLGKYNGTWDFKPASDPSKNIFPIPGPQLNANINLQQNPGYN
ncbi:MAG: RagB/SusD family nutrient uptake outer membrane protein [Bacteroidia bacterium]